jgi:hypothetical protein
VADRDLFLARAAAAPSLPPVACPFGRIHCRRRGARRRHLRCGLNIRRGLLRLRRRRERGKQVERVGGGGGAPRWRLDSGHRRLCPLSRPAAEELHVVVAAMAWTVVELWAPDICFPSLPFRASARRHGGWGQAPREV